jgi:hypothetical protein
MNGLTSWLEMTAVAAAVRESVLLTGFLSGLHLVGMTLIGGSALVSGMRMIGIAFAEFPASDVTRVTRRNIAAGVTISVVSGMLLFAPRASTAIGSGYFQLKMLLLAAAVTVHFCDLLLINRPPGERNCVRLGGALSASFFRCHPGRLRLHPARGWTVLQVCAWLENSPIGAGPGTLWDFLIVVAIHIGASRFRRADRPRPRLPASGCRAVRSPRLSPPAAVGGRWLRNHVCQRRMLLVGYATAAMGTSTSASRSQPSVAPGQRMVLPSRTERASRPGTKAPAAVTARDGRPDLDRAVDRGDPGWPDDVLYDVLRLRNFEDADHRRGWHGCAPYLC